VVIGGSTASGKSALALALARATGGTIVNADSQQLFRDLPTLTARPTAGDEAEVPHRLYGVLGPEEQPSVGRWLALAEPVLHTAPATGPLILTGGSGLYIEALLRGVAPVPEIPAGLRAGLRAEAEALPAAALHERLRLLDPAMAERLRPGDRQRVLRALEVVLATGRSLAAWQRAGPGPRPPLPGPVVGVSLLPPAAVVNPRIEWRLRAMIEGGVLAEVRELAARRPGLATLPIAKVHGCRELLAVAQGRLDMAAAGASVAAQVRRYAKRQRTFFRGRLARELEPLPLLGEEPEALARLTGLLGLT
jgi:tRNA dimethylallyltransferase